MQIICSALGLMAFGSVRRQKRSTASLFEQRKAAAEEARMLARGRGNGNQAEEEQIEFATIQQQENFPLVAFRSSVLEII